jgi:hypothetical protein
MTSICCFKIVLKMVGSARAMEDISCEEVEDIEYYKGRGF